MAGMAVKKTCVLGGVLQPFGRRCGHEKQQLSNKNQNITLVAMGSNLVAIASDLEAIYLK